MADFKCMKKCFYNGLWEVGMKMIEVPEEKADEITKFGWDEADQHGHFIRIDTPHPKKPDESRKSAEVPPAEPQKKK